MDPKEVISEEESQALQASDLAGGDGDNPPPAAEGQVRDLHADHWERIVSDRIPALESINERLVSMLKSTGREFFRRTVEVSTSRGRSHRWGSYCRQLHVPTSINVMKFQPMGVTGAICLDADFVFSLTDIFFGGDGTGARAEDQISFTPIEAQLAKRFVERVALDIRESWSPFLDVDVSITSTETNPMFAKVATGSEMFNVTGIEFIVGGRELHMQLLLPTSLVETIRNIQDSGRAGDTGPESSRWASQLRQDVKDTRVALRAVLAETRISLRDLTQAKPGDVIPTEIPERIRIFAGEEPILEGTFGVCNNQNAVRISRAIPRPAKSAGDSNG